MKPSPWAGGRLLPRGPETRTTNRLSNKTLQLRTRVKTFSLPRRHSRRCPIEYTRKGAHSLSTFEKMPLSDHERFLFSPGSVIIKQNKYNSEYYKNQETEGRLRVRSMRTIPWIIDRLSVGFRTGQVPTASANRFRADRRRAEPER